MACFLQVSAFFIIIVMKKTVFLLFAFSLIIFSCKDEGDVVEEAVKEPVVVDCNCNTSDLEGKISELQRIICLQEAYISLQTAYNARKKIVSVSEIIEQDAAYWVITFADNTIIRLSESLVASWSENEMTGMFEIVLSDNRSFGFNRKEVIYPTGIVVLTQEISFLKNTEAVIEFRVNPSNAVFNFDVSSQDCRIAFDMVDKLATYSYVTVPERCRMIRVEQVRGADGNVMEGQYRAYIRDNGGVSPYRYVTALVLSTFDVNGDPIQISSAAIPVERKKDTGLPVVVIRTENKAEIRDKENWIPGGMRIDGIGEFDDYEGYVFIRGRGNSTWNYPKKPYAIKLESKDGILGMAPHKRWVLLANYMDRTLLRNHVAFEIARNTGLEWTPRGVFVELVLNDVHQGNYYLCEQIRVDVNRVDIKEMKSSDVEGERVTGGYLLELDTDFNEVNRFKSVRRELPVMIKEPDEETLSVEQFDYIRNFVDSTEILLYDPNFAGTREYASRIADTAFIDWWIVMELTFNYEAQYPRSCYLYKDRSGPLMAGPVWDFDWGTFRNVTGFCAKDALWYAQLFEDPVFVNKVKERWERFKPAFEKMVLFMEDESNRLLRSVELNDAMWSLENAPIINEDEDLPYNDAIYRMKLSYMNRLEWLDREIRFF
jgi:hypothetical protein